MSADREALCGALEIVLIRLRIGHTLRRAVEGLPELRSNIETQESWDRLFYSVNEGRLSAEKAVQSFLGNLRTRNRIDSLVQEKLFMPRLQAKIVAGLCVFLILALHFFLKGSSANAGPSWLASLIALAMVGSSYALTRAMLQRAQAPWLFMASWISFLSTLASLLAWGQTLGPALEESLKGAPLERAPQQIDARLKSLLESARRGSVAAPRALKVARARTWEFERALEHLSWIEDLFREGEPLTPLLDPLIRTQLESFERHLKNQAEKLGMKALIPLFVFNVPAFFGVLLTPLWSLLKNF